MAKHETSMSQTTSSLSAEAESFVPGRLKKSGGPPGPGPGSGAVHQGSAGDAENPLTAQQISQLPRYLTSCYPFVNNDPSSNARNNNPGWSGPVRANSNQSGHRMPVPQSGYNRPGGPGRHMKGQGPNVNVRHPFPGGHGPMPHNPSLMGAPTHPAHPVPGNMSNPPPNHPSLNPYLPYLQQLGMSQSPQAMPPGWPPQIPAEFGGQFSEQGMYRADLHGQYPVGTNPADWNILNAEKSRSSEKKKKKKSELPGNMVSIGIQNESGVQHNSGSGSKRKSKPKTIICKHAEIQTDFSDEIANLTLAEKPNSLYHKDNRSRIWLQRYNQDSSTDSEEKDSDSGYSSPLHRRNQASNGTHPVIGLPFGQPGLLAGPQNTAGLLPPQTGVLYPPFVPPSSVAAAYGGYTQPPNMLANNSSYANVAASYLQPRFSVPPPALPPSSTSGSVHLNPTNNKLDPPMMGTPSATASSNMAKSGTNSVSSHLRVSSAKTEPEEEEDASGKKKRRRSRRKKRRSSGEEVGALSDEPMDLQRAHSSSNVSRTSTIENDMTLHFDDEDEFPNLLSAAGGLPSSTPSQSSGPISYSDILKSQVPSLSQDSSVSSLDRYKYSGAQSGSSTPSEHKLATGKESKNARKRRKRREMASRAADEELAEISLEQHVLKELSSKTVPPQEEEKPPPPPPPPPPAPKSIGAGKKSKQPISLNFADMISALEQQQEQDKQKLQKAPTSTSTKTDKTQAITNPLDSTAPAKRGKEREIPKVKKPSPLKKVILKEREEKKRLRLLDETDPLSPDSSNSSQLASVAGMPLDSDLSQDGVSSKASSMDYTGTPASAEMSPISQTSPISMSPLSGSPLSSGVNSPIAGNHPTGPKSSVLMKIHSRRFREYCNQMLDKDIDTCCTLLLQDLVRFQDRLYHKDPIKAKSKRRIVLGLREVTKHLKLGRIKCVIISPNLERIQSKGGLDEALNTIIDLCTDQDVPFVFALGRRALGRACAKLVPVSVVGIFNYEGSDENFNNLMSLTEQGRNTYKDMVKNLELELDSLPRNATSTTPGAGGFAQLFPHLGHSRTPSACSAISFTSSILSEPISENYPHSEPETDSRGYEIVRDVSLKSNGPPKSEAGPHRTQADKVNGETYQQPASREEEEEEEEEEGSDSLDSSQGKRIIVECLNEYDADTEDNNTTSQKRKKASVSCASAMEELKDEVVENGKVEETTTEVEEAENELDDDNSSESTDRDSQIESSPVTVLPHIDSIHSLSSDVNMENLSQHSSKTVDLSVEVLSTHSSKTMEGDRGGRTTPDRASRNASSTPDQREPSNTSGNAGSSQRLRNVDNKERVQSWITETQKHLERLTLTNTNNNTLVADVSKVCDHNVVDTAGDKADQSDSSSGTPTQDQDSVVVNGTDAMVT